MGSSIAAVPLDEPAQWRASQRQELLPQALVVLAALREREEQLQVLRQQAPELLFQRLVLAQEARQPPALQQQELAALQQERASRPLVRLLRARVLQLSRLLPSRLFLRLPRLRRQLRLSLDPESVF